MEYPLNMRYYTTPEYAGELTRRNNIYNEMVRRQSQPVVSSETPLKVSMVCNLNAVDQFLKCLDFYQRALLAAYQQPTSGVARSHIYVPPRNSVHPVPKGQPIRVLAHSRRRRVHYRRRRHNLAPLSDDVSKPARNRKKLKNPDKSASGATRYPRSFFLIDSGQKEFDKMPSLK